MAHDEIDDGMDWYASPEEGLNTARGYAEKAVRQARIQVRHMLEIAAVHGLDVDLEDDRGRVEHWRPTREGEDGDRIKCDQLLRTAIANLVAAAVALTALHGNDTGTEAGQAQGAPG